MSTTFATINSAQPARKQRALALFDRCREAIQSRRQRAQLQAALSGLTDHELQDIGIARGEIDFAASCAAAGLDPRHGASPATR